MKTAVLRSIQIGQGIPKVFVPIVERGRGDILAMGKRLVHMGPDAVEWRADFYEDIHDRRAVMDTLGELRLCLGDVPLIFTCRTLGEGGMADMADEEYAALNRAAAASGWADGIDLELFSHGEHTPGLVDEIRSAGATVIGSCHVTGDVPSAEEMADMLLRMGDMGADIPKLAVYARCPKDAAALMAATRQARDAGIGPVITMAVGEQGIISRITGELFGSAATFASVGKGSAPGQLPLGAMREILKRIHESI